MEQDNPKSFTNAQDVYEWLSSFINLERGQDKRSFRLDRMEYLASLAGHPEHSALSIHIAGSKGKGSVATMIGAILHSAGLKTARYLSPHLNDFRERISLASGFFDDSTYAQVGEELRSLVTKAVKDCPALFDPSMPQGEEPTFFELATLYYFLCVRHSHCDASVLETGMGGRLDATNLVLPRVSVITPIELEHTEILGNTLTAIAGEKAGIIKRRIPVLSSEQRDEVRRVLERKAQELQAPFSYLPEEALISQVRMDEEQLIFNLRIRGLIGSMHLTDIVLPLTGRIQAENAALAVSAVRTAFPELSEEAVRKGLHSVRLPGRFEKVAKDPPIILDGAHTPRSVGLTMDTFTQLYGKDGVLLFACAADKDAQAMAHILVSSFKIVIISTPGTFKRSDPDRLYQAFVDAAGTQTVQCLQINDTSKAIEEGVRRARALKLPLLVTGSFYLVAQARRIPFL